MRKITGGNPVIPLNTWISRNLTGENPVINNRPPQEHHPWTNTAFSFHDVKKAPFEYLATCSTDPLDFPNGAEF